MIGPTALIKGSHFGAVAWGGDYIAPQSQPRKPALIKNSQTE